MSNQQHIIKKQILELELSSEKEAFELQNQVSKIYRDKIVPLIDTYCNQLSSPDIIDKINRLELNLGSVDINNLEQDLIQKVEVQIKQQLSKKIQANNLFSSSLERSRSTTSDLETIGYFIKTGTLPWYSKKLSKQELDKCFDKLTETSPNQVKRFIIEFSKDRNYLKRIIYQFSDSTLTKITKLFSVELSKFITDYNQEIKKILNEVDNFKHISSAKFRLELWQGILLSFSFNQNPQFKPSQFVKENLLHLSTSFSLNYTSLINNINKTVERLQKENKYTFKSQLPEILAQIQTQIQPTETFKARSLSTQSQNSEYPISDRFSDADEIYINNSGLILLWPFYKQLFTKIGLLQENNFIDTNATQKAVLILQYLVDATIEIPESNLPLNKILCGVDIFEPIETSLDISDAEIDECETLLAAAIANWSILKNTSIDGLRKTFLQRDGILRIRHGSWLLQIERQTHDILLDKIPWSIRVIKLPWIDETLYVEW